jgi:hypothetical protein
MDRHQSICRIFAADRTNLIQEASRTSGRAAMVQGVTRVLKRTSRRRVDLSVDFPAVQKARNRLAHGHRVTEEGGGAHPCNHTPPFGQD